MTRVACKTVEKLVTYTAKVWEFDKIFVVKRADYKESFAVRKKLVKELKKEHGEQWSLEEIDYTDKLHGISKYYLQHYRDHPDVEPNYKKCDANTLKLAREGKWDQIVQLSRGDDGYFYDISGKPVWRKFYINLSEDFFNFMEVKTILKGSKQIERLQMGKSSWWHTTKYLEFFFVPSHKEFTKIWKEDTSGGLGSDEDCIQKILGITYKNRDNDN